MPQVMMFRKDAVKAPRMGKRQIAEALATIAKTARVQRDEVVTFVLGGGLNKLAITPQHVVDSPIKREAEGIGWAVPESSLGRGGEATFSQAESLRLWLAKNVGPILVERVGKDEAEAILHSIAVVFIPDAS